MKIPNGWVEHKLIDLTYESRIRLGRKNPEKLPVYGVNNQTGLNRDPRYFSDNLDRYKIVKPGMFAYNPMRLNIGSIGYCEPSFGSGLVSPDYVVFGCKEDLLNSKFLHLCTQGYQWKQWMYRAGAGSVRVRIYYNDIGHYKLFLPPLPEQRKIAEILSTWDAAITKTEQLIEALHQRKKGLMQRLLTGQIRFPGFDGEWKEVKLGEIAKYYRGYSYKSNDYSDDPTNYNFITLKCIGRGGGFQKNGLKFLLHDVDKKFQVNEGDLIFAITDITREGNVVGAPILMPKFENKTSILSMDLIKIKLSRNVDRYFLYYLMQLPSIRNTFRSLSSGSTVLHLDVNGTKRIKFKMPPILEEQKKISSLLILIDDYIQKLEAKKSKVLLQRKGLMQRLLTGQVRVKVD